MNPDYLSLMVRRHKMNLHLFRLLVASLKAQRATGLQYFIAFSLRCSRHRYRLVIEVFECNAYRMTQTYPPFSPRHLDGRHVI